MANNPVDPESIQEVQQYEEAKEMLEVFTESNKSTFDTYQVLVEDLNTKRDAADKVVRAKKVSVSDWDWYQTTVKYNAEKLFDHMGREGFLAVGGKLNTQTVYDIDKAKVVASINKGAIPKDVIEDVKTETPKYHAPKDISL